MRQAAIHNKDVMAEPIVKGLSIRLHRLIIINQKDCLKIKTKRWMEKKELREIHDVLRVQGYNWLGNGTDSYCIR